MSESRIPCYEEVQASAVTNFTYFVLDQASGAVKIGLSKNPIARMRDLQIGNPNPLMLVALAPGNREREFHQMLWQAAEPYVGEWFDASSSTVQSLMQHYRIKQLRASAHKDFHVEWPAPGELYRVGEF